MYNLIGYYYCLSYKYKCQEEEAGFADLSDVDQDQPDADQDQPDADQDQPDVDQPDADQDQPDADQDQPDADPERVRERVKERVKVEKWLKVKEKQESVLRKQKESAPPQKEHYLKQCVPLKNIK